MGLLGIVIACLVGWLWWKGYLGHDAGRKLALAGGGVLSLWLMARGQMVPGIAIGAATLGLGFAGWMRNRVAVMPMDEIEARQILGLGLSATDAEILAAHRRIIAQVHPDKFPDGTGSPDLARRVNAARDRLLRKAPSSRG